MNFVLATHDDQKVFEVSNVMADGAAAFCMKSRGFAVNKLFYIGKEQLGTFITQLKIMQNTFTGEARLGHMYEDDYVQFSINQRGQVVIKAELFEHSDHSQQILLEFQTDQTCLADLLKTAQQWNEVIK